MFYHLCVFFFDGAFFLLCGYFFFRCRHARPFREFVDEFARDQEAFFSCFAENWQKLQELGVEKEKVREKL
jgi:hypothetical protein